MEYGILFLYCNTENIIPLRICHHRSNYYNSLENNNVLEMSIYTICADKLFNYEWAQFLRYITKNSEYGWFHTAPNSRRFGASDWNVINNIEAHLDWISPRASHPATCTPRLECQLLADNVCLFPLSARGNLQIMHALFLPARRTRALIIIWSFVNARCRSIKAADANLMRSAPATDSLSTPL